MEKYTLCVAGVIDNLNSFMAKVSVYTGSEILEVVRWAKEAMTDNNLETHEIEFLQAAIKYMKAEHKGYKEMEEV